MIQDKFIHKCTSYKIFTFCALSLPKQVYTFLCVTLLFVFSKSKNLLLWQHAVGHNLRKAKWKQELKEKEPLNVKTFNQIALTICPLTLDCQMYFLSLKVLHSHTNRDSLIRQFCSAVCHYYIYSPFNFKKRDKEISWERIKIMVQQRTFRWLCCSIYSIIWGWERQGKVIWVNTKRTWFCSSYPSWKIAINVGTWWMHEIYI